MYKKYNQEKLELLKNKMKKKDVYSIQTLPFPYVIGREEEERERDCVLEYDLYLDDFTLIDLEEDHLLQDTYDLVIDDDLIDELLDQLATFSGNFWKQYIIGD